MKGISRTFLFTLLLTALLISACGSAGTSAPESETSVGSGKPQASLIEFTGVIEAIDGDQWTINGQVITVGSSVLRDGPFVVGDTVKVEAEVQEDGSVVVTRVELPADSTDDNANDDNANVNDNGNLNENANVNENENANVNENENSNDNENANDDNSNDDDSNSNDDDDDDENDNDDDDDDNDDNSGSGSDD